MVEGGGRGGVGGVGGCKPFLSSPNPDRFIIVVFLSGRGRQSCGGTAIMVLVTKELYAFLARSVLFKYVRPSVLKPTLRISIVTGDPS